MIILVLLLVSTNMTQEIKEESVLVIVPVIDSTYPAQIVSLVLETDAPVEKPNILE